MASDLIFKRSPGPATSPVTFVFGSGEVSALAADLEVSLPGPQINWHLAPPHDSAADFTLPGPQVVIQAVKAHNSNLLMVLGLPQVEIDSQVFTQVKVDADLSATLPGPQVVFYAVKPHDSTSDFSLPGPEVLWQGQYDSQTSRPTVGRVSARFQKASGFEDGAQHGYSVGRLFETGASSSYQKATGIQGVSGADWEKGFPSRTGVGSTFQKADRLRAAGSSRFQQGAPTRASKAAEHQKALGLVAINCTALHQVMLRNARPWYASLWQSSDFIRLHWRTTETDAMALEIRAMGARFQQAMKPLQEVSFEPFPVRPPHSCYTDPLPGRADFLFFRPPNNSSTLVFGCRHPEVKPWVVPTRKVYVVKNVVSFSRVSDGAPLAVSQATISGDRGSWTWGLDATIHISDLSKVDPGVAGPVEIMATINGYSWKFLVEDYRDNRQFGVNSATISGRSVTARLDSPYARKLSYVQMSPVMSKALAETILAPGGVSLGFSLDWDLVDVLGWQVPSESWSYQQLTPIQALKSVAESVGGYVMSHPSDDVLLVRTGYPEKSWAWDTATPDFSLPMSVIVSRSLSWTEKPAYNAVFVSGEKKGYRSMAKIAATAGDYEAPQFSHALLTDPSALAEAAKNILSQGGPQADISIVMPLGASIVPLITPGNLLSITGDESWRALSRGVSISMSVDAVGSVEVLQTVAVERHYWS